MKHIKRPLRAHFLRLLVLAGMLAFSNAATAGAASPISEPGPNFRDLQHLEDTTHQRIQELKGIVAAQDEKTWLRIEGFEKQIESQQQAINHVMSQADWMSIFIMTALVALGFTTFFSSRKQAREAVRTWVEKNKDEVLGQLKDKMQSAIDESVRTLEVEIIKKVKLDDLLERTAQKLAEKGDAAFTLNDKAALNRAAQDSKSKPEDERTYQDWEGIAIDAFSKGNYEDAVRLFDLASRVENATNIDIAGAFFHKGLALYKAGKLENSIAIYDELDKRFGDTDDMTLRQFVVIALYNKGVSLYELGNLNESITTYTDLGKRYGGDVESALYEHIGKALINKGVILTEQGMPDGAITTYDEVITHIGDATEPNLRKLVAKALVRKGVTLNKQGKHEKTITIHKEVIKNFGSDADSSVQLEVTDSYNGLADARRNMAKKVWLSSGIDGEARELLERSIVDAGRALKIDPVHKHALGNKGYALFLLNQPKEAESLLRQALGLGDEKYRDDILVDAAIHHVPEDEEFVALINRLWDEILAERATDA